MPISKVYLPFQQMFAFTILARPTNTMGCLKITENTGVTQIDENHFFLGDTYGKKEVPQNFCNDYYPFGLSFNSYTRAASTAQNFKFNAGSELEEMTDWYSTPFRKYDPSLGRFHGVDALASMYTGITPSHFGMNNPVNFNDPSGLTAAPVAGPVDMRSWDNLGGQGGGGNGGSRDAARSRSNGSVYNIAFGRQAGAATTLRGMIKEAWAKTATNSASTTNYRNGSPTSFRTGGYWKKKSSGTYGGYEIMTINGEEVLVLNNDVVIEQEFVPYTWYGNIGDGFGELFGIYGQMISQEAGIIPYTDGNSAGMPDIFENPERLAKVEMTDTSIGSVFSTMNFTNQVSAAIANMVALYQITMNYMNDRLNSDQLMRTYDPSSGIMKSDTLKFFAYPGGPLKSVITRDTLYNTMDSTKYNINNQNYLDKQPWTD